METLAYVFVVLCAVAWGLYISLLAVPQYFALALVVLGSAAIATVAVPVF